LTEPTSEGPPRIEFPCDDYPVKIVGENRDAFAEVVIELVRRHAPEITDAHVKVRPSNAGNYCSVTISIRATGEVQLRELHETLKAHPLVHLVL
jgi:putative lipoic acid-binding regulatory protein